MNPIVNGFHAVIRDMNEYINAKDLRPNAVEIVVINE